MFDPSQYSNLKIKGLLIIIKVDVNNYIYYQKSFDPQTGLEITPLTGVIDLVALSNQVNFLQTQIINLNLIISDVKLL